MQIDFVEKSMQAGKDFAALVAPLELVVGQRLKGKPRRECEDAFAESPEGFARCVDKALVRASVNPVGLLVKLIRDGDHRFAPAATSGLPDRWRAWAQCTAPRLSADDRLAVLEDAGLRAVEIAQVLDLVERAAT